MIDQIKDLSASIFDQTVHHRRHLHAHPELSYQEFETAKFVKGQLEAIGLKPQGGIAGTGVSATIQGKNPTSKIIALRADMDALPIQQISDQAYKSTTPGVMHACGHDVHTSSLLATAKILHELRDKFAGSIKLIFQPGEEKLPGGASLMIKEGILSNPNPSAIFGQHVMPLIETGKVGFRKGMYMASADEIYITVKGKGGHAAMPESLIDPVLISSHLIVALQQIVSRNADPKTPSVLSFGKVEAIGATNVIPDDVTIQGTFRTLNESWRSKAHESIKKIATSLSESLGGTCDVEIRKGYPYLENDPELTQKAIDAAKDFLGEENVEELDIWMGAEDFAYYSQQVPACFYRLGTRNEAFGITSRVHTPTFDIDEQALKIGPGLMAHLALQELGFAIK